MKLTTEQASALLAAEPFVIVRVVIDGEGYQNYDFPPILVATNVLWDMEELDKFVKDATQEIGSELASCEATYLFHMKLANEPYPTYGSFWEFVESELIATVPFVPDDGTAVEV